MMDGRRHSVDVPISRTLVALRRVRSLRDPGTNSMSKFSALLENGNWETNSNNGISIRFENGFEEGDAVDNGLRGSMNLGIFRMREEYDDFEMHSCSRKFKLGCDHSGRLGKAGTPLRTEKAEGLDCNEFNQEKIFRNKSLSERYCSSYRDKELDLNCVTPSCDRVEDVASYRASILDTSHVERANNAVTKRKPSQYKYQVKSSRPVGDADSCTGSSYPSVDDSFSSHSQSLSGNEVVNAVDFNHQGCGINCWPRTPRFRESNISSDAEDNPLLSQEIGQVSLFGKGSLKCVSGELTPYSETPRSLSEKFRPKSFDDLVGQNVVVRSLLGAISKERITSFYLFYGPRGTGKTCASRIFAAALNCLSLDRQKPCGMCRECILFFSGRSRDTKEVDSVRINRTGRIRSLIKNAVIPPVSSRFKVFIIDECQLLLGETWATLLNSVEDLSQHVVFVMITPDLDNLPRTAVSRSQSCHFPKITDADIASRLEKICIIEGLDHDQPSLDFIAAKSNGSLRDAETMLDQLSLLGKRITLSLVHELIGVVSDDELLDLLDLALSSDTSNTVIKARELMRSRIDPMQLISQLANLIMDILAGKCQEGSSEVRKSFFGRHNSEADLQKLSHALKILTETEKQLRMSKNQTTWLTVALLQLSSVESSSSYTNEPKLCLEKTQDSGGDKSSASATEESSMHPSSSDDSKKYKLEIQEDFKGTLETIWRKTTELCQSNSLRKILRKQGKLVSLRVNQGLAVADLEFYHSDYVSRAEKSWKLIASSLQSILGCNVEIRINLVSSASGMKCSKVKKPSFSLFSCSRRTRQKSQSTAERQSESDSSEHISEKPMIMDRVVETCSSDCGSHMQHGCSHRTEPVTALRNREGNVLSTGALPLKLLQDDEPKSGLGVKSSKEWGTNLGNLDSSAEEPEVQPNCFSRTLSLHRKLHSSSDPSKTTAMSVQTQKNLALSIPGKASFETYVCAHGPYVFCGSSDKYSNSFRDEAELREGSDVHCWRIPRFPFKKAWELRHQRQSSHLARWLLPCPSAN